MKLISLLVCALTAFTGYAQELSLHFRHLTSRDGLSAEEVLCFFKDSRGFLWMGTKAGGVNRWDGSNVKRFTRVPGDTNTLINNEVTSITEDPSGHIWVATKGGLSVLNHDNRFRNFPSLKTDTGSVDLSHGIFSLGFFKGKIFMGLPNGIIAVSPDRKVVIPSGKLLKHGEVPPILRCIPNGMHVTNSGIWVSTFKGMFYSPDGVIFYHKGFNPLKIQMLDMGFIPAFCEASDKHLMFINWKFPGIYAYNPSANKLDSITFSDEVEFSPMSLIQIREDVFWASTMMKGLVEISIKNKSFRYIHHDDAIPGSLSNDGVTHLFRDAQGSFFVATGFGVDYVHPSQCNFTPVKLEVSDKTPFPARSNYTLYRDSKKQLWASCFNNGVFKINTNGTVEHSAMVEDENAVWCMYENDGKLLLATYAGLGYYNPITKKWDKIPLQPEVEEIIGNGITFITRDLKQNWILGVWQYGLIILDPQFKLPKFFEPGDGSNVLLKATPEGFAIDPDNNLWFGYLENTDLTCLNLNTLVSTHFSPLHKWNLNPGWTNSMLLKNSDLWITTSHAGLVKFNIQNHTSRVFNSANGMPADLMNDIQEDNQGNFWIASSNGLIKFNPKTFAVRNFHYSDGLPAEFLDEASIWLDPDGTGWMTCDRYLLNFNTNKFTENPNFPKIALLGVRISGIEIPIISGHYECDLRHSDKMISFEFTGINFIDPEKNRYSYFLEGLNQGWTELNKTTSINFTTLPPGNYILHLRCTNKNQIENPETLRFVIHVHGPFWKTWWFISLMILFAGLIVYLIYRNRLKQIYQLQAIRDKISKDLHDDIGSALSSISIYSDVAIKMSSDKIPEMVPILQNLKETARSTMDNMSDIVWAINPRNDRFQDIIIRIEIFANQILHAKGTQFKFRVPDDISFKTLSIQQRKNIYLICKEAINNVAKYADAEECNLSVYKEQEQVVIAIEDNGKGISDMHKSMGGNGLLNMQKRAEEIHAMLEIITGNTRGTKLILKLNFK